tara:strand:- start:30 stop:272 length:243 start_codon:yes stop_codon:yes gene_type:complete
MTSFDLQIHPEETAAARDYDAWQDLAREIEEAELSDINAELQLASEDEDNYDDGWQDEYEEYILNQTRYDDDRDLDYYAS